MKRPMQYYCTITAIVTVVLSGCFTIKHPTNIVPKITPTFDFSPPSRATAGATGITIALINPIYVSRNNEYLISPFKEMASSMGNDFEELLTAKGFTIRGPFRSRDEMVYGDKLSSDFAFSIEIDLKPNYDRRYHFYQGYGSYVPSTYDMFGDITLEGNLILTASSPKYGEKIWKKNIALDPIRFSYDGSVKWAAVPDLTDEITRDPVLYNALASNLQTYYNKALALAWQQIEPAEMKTIVPEAKKADARPY